MNIPDWSAQAQDLPIAGRVGLATREVIEGHLGGLNDVPGNEGHGFGRPLLGALDAAFPFQDRPAAVAGLGEQCKTRVKSI